MRRTYYSVLHVLHNDSPETMREAYKRLRKSHEPGLLAHDKAIIAEARLAKEAFETLVDPVRKAAYDDAMSLSTASQAGRLEVTRVGFWTTGRVLIYSLLLILVLYVVIAGPSRSPPQGGAPYLKQPAPYVKNLGTAPQGSPVPASTEAAPAAKP
jgi:hypothetical protein